MRRMRACMVMVLAALLALLPCALPFALALQTDAPPAGLPASPPGFQGLLEGTPGRAVLPQPTLIPCVGEAQTPPHQPPCSTDTERLGLQTPRLAEWQTWVALRPGAERCYTDHPHHAPPATV